MSGFELRNRRNTSGAWLIRHLQSALSTLGMLARAPGTSLATAAVIGIALALPAGFLLLIDNAQRLGTGWDGAPRISVFLRTEVDDPAAGELATRLRARPRIRAVKMIGRAEALAEYRRLSGFGDVLEAFGSDNPLPAVLVVEPTASDLSVAAIEALLASLRALPEVELAQFDLEWLQRFRSIVALVKRAVAILGALLALGVVLVVGNTIRLTIENRREEIEIAKLFGASDAFVRRPFLYSGLWFGSMGGALAVALVGGATSFLHAPAARLATLYGSEFTLASLGAGSALTLVACGALLGLIGAWTAVGRHLRGIESA